MDPRCKADAHHAETQRLSSSDAMYCRTPTDGAQCGHRRGVPGRMGELRPTHGARRRGTARGHREGPYGDHGHGLDHTLVAASSSNRAGAGAARGPPDPFDRDCRGQDDRDWDTLQNSRVTGGLSHAHAGELPRTGRLTAGAPRVSRLRTVRRPSKSDARDAPNQSACTASWAAGSPTRTTR